MKKTDYLKSICQILCLGVIYVTPLKSYGLIDFHSANVFLNVKPLDCSYNNTYDVVVFWVTNLETNMDYFNIKRRTSTGNFTVIGTVNSCGTCSGHTYGFNDLGPFIAGETYIYEIEAVSNNQNYVHYSAGSKLIPNDNIVDWRYQATEIVDMSTSPQDPSLYQWSEIANTTQGVILNLIPSEIIPMELEQNNTLIKFTTEPDCELTSVAVSVDLQPFSNIYSGNGTETVDWVNLSSLTGTLGEHDLNVQLFSDCYGSAVYRKYIVNVVPACNGLYRDNYCNTMRLWSGGNPNNEMPIILSEGFDAYNVKPPQFYRHAADALIECMFDKGFKIYIIDYARNSQDIRRNAAVYASAISYLSGINNGVKIVATGVSMGGVIARYALANAEGNGNPLPVSRFVSIDSPQQYAVISQQLQVFRKCALDMGNASDFKHYALNNDAAKELLLYNVYDASGTIHSDFYTELNNLNGDGYPHLVPNIGIAFSNKSPNPNSGTWLTLGCDPCSIGSIPCAALGNNCSSSGFPIDISLTIGELLPGSFFPAENTNFALTYLHVPWSFYWILPGIGCGAFSFNRTNNPTFIPYVSALDKTGGVNGISKFDITIEPQNTYFHDVVPTENDFFNAIINAVISDDVYLQNKTITGSQYYLANKTITAGRNVTTTKPIGDFIIENGANVTLQAGEKIIGKPGFHIKSGAYGHAFIAPPDVQCNDGQIISQMKKGEDSTRNVNIFITQQSTNANSSDTAKSSLFINPPFSISNQKSTITIVPNPSHIGLFQLSVIGNQNQVKEITVTNRLGENIYQSSINASQSEINLSSSPPGLYFVKVITGDEVFVQKLILQ